jgi:hypothetical protein
MEESLLPQQADEIMMRMVDDSIFVTPYRDRAEMFLKIMIQGNCYSLLFVYSAKFRAFCIRPTCLSFPLKNNTVKLAVAVTFI